MREAERRVVVTGMGSVTPLGASLPAYAEALFAGRSGITRWKTQDERCYSKIGGDLSDFDLERHLACAAASCPSELVERARKLMRPTPIAGRLTAMASMQAWVAAGLADGRPKERCGHVLAGHNVNNGYVYAQHLQYVEEPEYIDPLFGVVSADTDVLSVTSELLELRGPSYTVGGACASGNLALLNALDMLRAGRADVVLVSGSAVDLEAPAMHAWALIDAISYRGFNDDPVRASRPFDALRDGFVPSQGSGAIVLETLAHARQRGVPVHAEILGGAAASDASRLTKPNLEGQVRTIRAALEDAQVERERIEYVNAHATSTPLGDAIEVAAVKAVFGARAHRIPMNATKSMLGHCLSASGVLELIATVVQLEAGVLHPTINQEQRDPELDLDFVPNQARPFRFATAISNAFGFGGINSCIVVGSRP